MENYFENEYLKLIQDGSSSLFNDFVHKQLEKNLNKDEYTNVLELGALNGYHKNFVKHSFNKYYETDILIKNNQEISKNHTRSFQDAENLSDFEDNSIDRVIATCLISHLKDPEKSLNEIKRVLNKGGCVSLWVANDPSILLRILQVLLRKPSFKKKGLDYDALQYRQHINYYTRINYLINDIFSEYKIKRKKLPFRIFSYHLNLVTIYQIYEF